ncbi:MAG: hypothetical protein ACRDIB_16430 [Ardenticatenaceae bacterium]
MEARYVFLIHWNAREAEEYADALRDAGYDVEVEARDGRRAHDFIKDDPPDAVVIFLSRQPAVGRQTAESIMELRQMQRVPLVFVDGREDAVVKAMSEFVGATFTKSSELSEVLNQLLASRPKRGVLSRLRNWF